MSTSFLIIPYRFMPFLLIALADSDVEKKKKKNNKNTVWL